MAETYALSDTPGGPGDRPAEERGELSITPTAVDHVMERASLAVGATVRHSTVIRKIAGGSYPKAQSRTRGDRVWATLDVAVTWPNPVAQIGREVRDHVRRETARLTGLVIESVDVTVHIVESDDTDERRVR